MRSQTFAVTGITGQVGGVVARNLLAGGHAVRAVVRSVEKGKVWATQGCDVAVAEMNDVGALEAAFAGSAGVFVLLPPNFAPLKGFPETAAIIAALHRALEAGTARQGCLPVNHRRSGEPAEFAHPVANDGARLGRLPIPVTFFTCRLVYGKCRWDVEAAIKTGLIQSFLQPLDKPVSDGCHRGYRPGGGRTASRACERAKLIELEGPRRVTPNDLAAAFSKALGRTIKAEAVPREKWLALFKAQGTGRPGSSHANARWLQRGLDRVRGRRGGFTQRHSSC